MRITYHDKLRATFEPFIITQIGTLQNEFILAPEHMMLDKDGFSQVLYGQVDYMNVAETFIRMFYYKERIYLVYYWATNKVEEQTNRTGLFVICGIVAPAAYFWADINLPIYFFRQLMSMVSKETFANLDSAYSDETFCCLQNNYEEIIKKICDQYDRIPGTVPNDSNVRRKVRFSKTGSKISYIYIWDDSFINRLSVFVYEAARIYAGRLSHFDISTITDLTLHTLIFLRNKEQFPYNINKVSLYKYLDIKYIKASY